MAITTACYKDVKELVSPFYDAASLPTASLNTLKNRARALYKQHKGLIKDKVQDPPRIGFDERCRQVFPAAPAGILNLPHQEVFKSLEVDTQ